MAELFPASLLDRLSASRVVAGFSVDRAQDAVPIAEALLAGGLDAIELTLRTDAALDAVAAIAERVPGILLGVGTILTAAQAVATKRAGAHFGVAPGTNRGVMDAAAEAGLPFAPGVATPSDLEAAIEAGARFVKLFPADALGGPAYLRSMSAPYAHLGIRYFPLGGVNADNLADYLSLPGVTAVGGSWIVRKDLVAAGDWAGITARARAAVEAAAAPASG